jgi:membrane-bound lytic murein transglycosylase B
MRTPPDRWLPRLASRWLPLLAICLAGMGTPLARAIDIHRADVKSFIDEVAEKDSIAKSPLRKLLKAAKSQPAIIEAMDRPAEKAKPWFEYRPIFLTERRIKEGTEFWIAHRQQLDRASIRSGVAPEYLAAIVGVETYYGRMTGSYRVVDALATLAFDYPARAKFFRDELEQYILLSRELGVDPLSLKGSYAGAMGAPQFMPSNYRRFAVDADADGHIDLWNNWSDVCASVGNYLKEHGWNAGEPVLSEASVEPDKIAELDGHKLALADTVESLKAKGVTFDSSLPPDAPVILVAADEADGVHWRVGYNNFYVITRYNHSALYAMAVYELASAVKQRVLAHDAAANNASISDAAPHAAATRDPSVHDPAAHDPSAHDSAAHDSVEHDLAPHDPAAGTATRTPTTGAAVTHGIERVSAQP